MKVDIIVEGEHTGETGRTEPRYRVPANREKDERHVELESLCSSLGCGQAVAHDFECIHVFVLDELPCEECSHDPNPECNHPQPLPVLLQVVDQFGAQIPNRPLLS